MENKCLECECHYNIKYSGAYNPELFCSTECESDYENEECDLDDLIYGEEK